MSENELDKRVNELLDNQVVEVEYDKDLVEEYKKQYIAEEEGIGATDEAIPYDIQTTFNEDTAEEMLGEEAEILDDDTDK